MKIANVSSYLTFFIHFVNNRLCSLFSMFEIGWGVFKYKYICLFSVKVRIMIYLKKRKYHSQKKLNDAMPWSYKTYCFSIKLYQNLILLYMYIYLLYFESLVLIYVNIFLLLSYSSFCTKIRKTSLLSPQNILQNKKPYLV